MPDLNIRNVPQGLMRFLKSDAAYRGQTLREHCLEKLEVVSDATGQNQSGGIRSEEVSGHREGVDVGAKPRKPSVRKSALRSVTKVESGPDEGVGGNAEAVTVSGMGWSALGLVTGRELLEDESSCSYKEYDQESGETMGCGLAKHSAKQKHGNWRRL